MSVRAPTPRQAERIIRLSKRCHDLAFTRSRGWWQNYDVRTFLGEGDPRCKQRIRDNKYIMHNPFQAQRVAGHLFGCTADLMDELGMSPVFTGPYGVPDISVPWAKLRLELIGCASNTVMSRHTPSIFHEVMGYPVGVAVVVHCSEDQPPNIMLADDEPVQWVTPRTGVVLCSGETSLECQPVSGKVRTTEVVMRRMHF